MLKIAWKNLAYSCQHGQFRQISSVVECAYRYDHYGKFWKLLHVVKNIVIDNNVMYYFQNTTGHRIDKLSNRMVNKEKTNFVLT